MLPYNVFCDKKKLLAYYLNFGNFKWENGFKERRYDVIYLKKSTSTSFSGHQ